MRPYNYVSYTMGGKNPSQYNYHYETKHPGVSQPTPSPYSAPPSHPAPPVYPGTKSAFSYYPAPSHAPPSYSRPLQPSPYTTPKPLSYSTPKPLTYTNPKPLEYSTPKPIAFPSPQPIIYSPSLLASPAPASVTYTSPAPLISYSTPGPPAYSLSPPYKAGPAYSAPHHVSRDRLDWPCTARHTTHMPSPSLQGYCSQYIGNFI